MSKKVDPIGLMVYLSADYDYEESAMRNKQRKSGSLVLLPIFGCEQFDDRKVWRFLYVPIFTVRRISKGLITIYYVLNIPVLQKSQRFL